MGMETFLRSIISRSIGRAKPYYQVASLNRDYILTLMAQTLYGQDLGVDSGPQATAIWREV